MTFRPYPRLDRWSALAFLLALLSLDALLARAALTRPVDGGTFILGLGVLVSLPIWGYVGYRVVGAFTLEYWVSRDAVTMVWGATRQIVPLGQIQRIVRGVTGQPSTPLRPWHWPYPERRRIAYPGLGNVISYATRPLAGQIILITADASYGLSPADPEGFLAALQTCYRLGVMRPLQAELRRPPLWTWGLWRDRTALFLIIAGLLGVLAMFGAFAFRFPTLSADLPMHFDVNGIPDRIAPKAGLVLLPAIGLLTWTLNLALGVWLYRRAQAQAAYLLWGGALVVQGIAGLALLNLMRW
jgi:hypothetical protein